MGRNVFPKPQNPISLIAFWSCWVDSREGLTYITDTTTMMVAYKLVMLTVLHLLRWQQSSHLMNLHLRLRVFVFANFVLQRVNCICVAKTSDSSDAPIHNTIKVLLDAIRRQECKRLRLAVFT